MRFSFWQQKNTRNAIVLHRTQLLAESLEKLSKANKAFKLSSHIYTVIQAVIETVRKAKVGFISRLNAFRLGATPNTYTGATIGAKSAGFSNLFWNKKKQLKYGEKMKPSEMSLNVSREMEEEVKNSIYSRK